MRPASIFLIIELSNSRPMVMAAVQNLKDQGLYPQKLWQ